MTDIATATTWRPVDLTDALAGHEPPPPNYLARTDGRRLLYAGRTHQFAGESESCKTWAALLAVAEVLAEGGRVLWIDYEDDAVGIVSRLRALLVDVDVIAARFLYVRPDEPLMTRDGRFTAGAADFADLLEHPIALAVIDGVTEGMTIEGLDLNSNSDVATWMRRVPKRIALTGAAVVAIDHVTKSTDGRGRYAIGGQHKLAGLTGAAFRFDIERRFSRATGPDPITATVGITVVKDRPGHVRGHATDDRIGTLELTSYPDGAVTGNIIPPGGTTGADLVLVGRIAAYLAQYDGATKNAITSDVEGKAESIRNAIRWMADPARAWVQIERTGQTHRHHLTDTGRTECL
jgi:hypothetical protein